MKPKNRLLPYILCVLLPALAFTGVFFAARAGFRAKENARIAAEIGAVRAYAPGLSDEEILALLTGEDHADEGNAFLQKYGIFGDTFATPYGKRFAVVSLFCILGAALSIGAALGTAALLRERRREKELDRLSRYLSDVAEGRDALLIGENSEAALSKLYNNVYKLTVLLRETAAENEKRSRALSDSLADISHQIRTPLTSVSIMLENIAENPDMDMATRADFLNEARRQLRLIADLCAALLTLSRFDSGTVKLHPVPLTAGELADAAVKNLAVLLDVRNVCVHISGDREARFTADRRWQTEALSNILKNAAEHSPENGEIRIEIENTGIFVVIRVSDAGEGIDEADLPHVFERFYKAKNAGAQSFGVGLALAKTVVEKDGGFVRAESRKGEGSTFTLSYPRT